MKLYFAGPLFSTSQSHVGCRGDRRSSCRKPIVLVRTDFRTMAPLASTTRCSPRRHRCQPMLTALGRTIVWTRGDSTGGPDPCARLVADSSAPGRIALQEVPEPVPAPGEVLVDVRAFSINRGEMRMLGTADDGWRPGWDFAGILRSDVEHGLRAGARVVGIRRGGSWAEQVAVHEGWIAELPDRSLLCSRGDATNGRPGSPAHAPNGTIDPRSPSLGNGGLGRGRPVCDPAGAPRWRGGDGDGQQPIGAGGRTSPARCR